MSTRFINLKPDKRLERLSWPVIFSFLIMMILTMIALGEANPTMALVLLPFEFALCLFLFQGKSPAYWARMVIFYLRESRQTANHPDAQGQISLSELKEYKKALIIKQTEER